jgi:transposase
MDKWQERGLAIAESDTVERNKLGWKVPSQSGNGTYEVNIDGESFCTCQHFEATHKKCQHIYAVEFIEQKEKRPDGTEVTTKAMRVTYAQDWPVYNKVQTHEQEQFVMLLRDICNGIEQPEYKFGRPRLPLADVMFGLVFKTYSTMSGRRFMPDIREAAAKELVAKTPSFTSIFRYFENPELTPLLKTLIEQSAMPLRDIETDFAVDSSGFATTTYARWFDHKWGKERIRQTWVKTHLICGVKTHVVTSAEATAYESADNIQFPELVEKTAKTFAINEVSADKAYSGRKNLRAVQAVGGQANTKHKFDGLWYRMWHFYNYNREAFMQHYHKRSNAETVFSMIKMKFGGAVRSKTPVAQVNEVLCKILCHNICVLIQSIYELGLEPTFWQPLEPQKMITPKMAWE